MDNEVVVFIKSDGTAVGIAYWFTLLLYGDIVMTTGPEQNSVSKHTNHCENV